MWSVETEDEARVQLRAGLDEIVREGARRMLAAALEAEADAYVEALVGEVDERGHRLVVRNGRARQRSVTVLSELRPQGPQAPNVVIGWRVARFSEGPLDAPDDAGFRSVV